MGLTPDLQRLSLFGYCDGYQLNLSICIEYVCMYGEIQIHALCYRLKIHANKLDEEKVECLIKRGLEKI